MEACIQVSGCLVFECCLRHSMSIDASFGQAAFSPDLVASPQGQQIHFVNHWTVVFCSRLMRSGEPPNERGIVDEP